MAAGTLGDYFEPPTITMEEVKEMMLRHSKPELDPSQLITPPGAQVHIRTSQEQFSDVNMVTPDKIPKDHPKRRPKKTQFEIANDLYGPVYQVYGPDGFPIPGEYRTESGHTWWDTCECEVCLENANETELELEEERRWGPRPEYQRARAELYKKKGAKKRSHLSRGYRKDMITTIPKSA
jgi:hypothetical protein